MNKDIDLKEIERKAFRSTHQDGLWDIFMGIIILAMGINGTLSNLGIEEYIGTFIFLTIEILAIIILIAGKRYITVPRMGIIKPGAKRKKKLHRARLVLLVSFIFGLLMFLLPAAITSSGGEVSRPWYFISVIFALNILIVLGLLAYYMDNDRLYFIAVLFASTLPIKEILGLFFDSPFINLIAFGIPGAAVMIMGLFYLERFIKDYEIPNEEVADGLHG